METIATQGTTIKVLAPYLPYGIDVRELQTGNVYVLGGLSDANNAKCNFSGGSIGKPINALLPKLYSFAALCTPLADGTIPALEAAKLAFSYADKADRRERLDNAKPFMQAIEADAPQCLVIISGFIRFFITHKWEIGWDAGQGNQLIENTVATYDYLRSQHFAVGLEPHQYIRKEAAPATPATREEVGA